MELKGKKIAFLGDSITEGSGVEDLENLYWKRIEKSTGALCFGYGIGGTRIASQDQLVSFEDATIHRPFGERVADMIPDADVVVVFGGTNDFGHGDAAFGSMTDRSGRTFCGAAHLLMEKLIDRYPDAQIVLMTPLHRDTEAEADYNEFGVRRCGILENYVDALIEIGGYYGVPVLDLFRVSGLQPRVPIIRQKFMPDGLHPNDAGHARIAQKLEGFLKTL